MLLFFEKIVKIWKYIENFEFFKKNFESFRNF